jgi:sporulation protein YlmC with PRC-barrel domain
MFKTFTLSAATAALLATGALAQTQPSPATPANPPAAAPSAPSTGSATSTTTTTQTQSINFKSSMAQDEMLASELSGLDVRNAAGENLGDINDIVMDKAGKPQVAIIGVGGFLGLGEKDVGVPFESLTFAPASDGKNVARLDVTKEALQSAPNYVYKDRMTASGGTGRDVNSTGALGTSDRPAAPAAPRPAQ